MTYAPMPGLESLDAVSNVEKTPMLVEMSALVRLIQCQIAARHCAKACWGGNFLVAF
ncbi:MAG: hypothetical protein H6888_02760 [Nitratireductor sp.]|nr:hypothetical protein [Nitratireductor sp.]MCC0019975.1 hypothetical protein [Nitratireductor sp.]